MAGRPKSTKANIEMIRKAKGTGIDTRPLIAYVMRYCGCSYTEIAEVFGISRQSALNIVKGVEETL